MTRAAIVPHSSTKFIRPVTASCQRLAQLHWSRGHCAARGVLFGPHRCRTSIKRRLTAAAHGPSRRRGSLRAARGAPPRSRGLAAGPLPFVDSAPRHVDSHNAPQRALRCDQVGSSAGEPGTRNAFRPAAAGVVEILAVACGPYPDCVMAAIVFTSKPPIPNRWWTSYGITSRSRYPPTIWDD